MSTNIYHNLISQKQQQKKQFAVLIDPDKVTTQNIDTLINLGITNKVDYFFVGGSLVMSNKLDECILQIKQNCQIPVVLFPGSPAQVSKHADALLYLSLISGRNADLLIGQHVLSAVQVKKTGLEIIPTGYMVIDGGVPTAVSYISNALPIPANKCDIAVCTALAGEMLGLKVMYLDAGSGAQNPISSSMIKKVAASVQTPIIVGGGICTPQAALNACQAGADVIVVGNAIEKDPQLIAGISQAIHGLN